MEFTKNEIAILKGSRDNEFEDALTGGHPWVFSVIDASGLAPEVARGVISSLVKKGIADVSDYEGKGRSNDMVFSLTALGIQEANRLFPKVAYILKGEPGVGKTTLGEIIAPGTVFSSDDFPGLYIDGKYQLSLQQASHDWNLERVEQAMRSDVYPIVIANTSMRRKYYQKYLDLCQEYGYTASIWKGEGTLLPDNSPTKNIHGVPSGILLRMRSQYEPYVHQISPTWDFYAVEELSTLRVFDKDCTLVFNPNGGIPTVGQQKPIYGIKEKIATFKENGDIIAVITNQAGLVTKNKETGEFHKTPESLLLELKELLTLFPEIDLICACPDYEGDRLLVLKPGDDDFLEVKQDEGFQPFRKPGVGAYQFVFRHFWDAYGQVAAYGNSQEDYLAALAANMPYQHVHELIYS